MRNHTQGPWATTLDASGDLFRITGPMGVTVGYALLSAVCVPSGTYTITREELASNARLIAAAPDLLAALNRLLEFYIIEDMPSTLPCMGPKDKEIEDAWLAARAVIAKTTGT